MTSAEPGWKAPHSCDIRWRVVWQRVGMELPFKTIAMNLNIAASTAYLHCKRFQNTAKVRPTSQPQREFTKKLSSRDELFVIGLFLANPTVYLYEICQQVKEVFGKSVSPPTVCHLLARYGMTRKSLRSLLNVVCIIEQLFSHKWPATKASSWCGLMRRDAITVSMFESMAMPYVGRRQFTTALYTADVGFRPLLLWHKMVLLPKTFTQVRLMGMHLQTVRGSLIPQMQAFDGEAERSIVVMDNCSIHHTEAVADLFRYSPDLNPIEFVFSYVKSYLRCHDTLLQAIDDPSPVIKSSIWECNKTTLSALDY